MEVWYNYITVSKNQKNIKMPLFLRNTFLAAILLHKVINHMYVDIHKSYLCIYRSVLWHDYMFFSSPNDRYWIYFHSFFTTTTIQNKNLLKFLQTCILERSFGLKYIQYHFISCDLVAYQSSFPICVFPTLMYESTNK